MEERETKGKKPPLMQNCRAGRRFITQKQVLLIQGKKGCVGQGGISAGGRKTYRSILSFPGNEKEKTFKII